MKKILFLVAVLLSSLLSAEVCLFKKEVVKETRQAFYTYCVDGYEWLSLDVKSASQKTHIIDYYGRLVAPVACACPSDLNQSGQI